MRIVEAAKVTKNRLPDGGRPTMAASFTKLSMIEFDQEVCGDLEQASSREWLETNGLGGFASSTLTGLNTRRYHGLLVAAVRPPVGRSVLLSKLEEVLIVSGPGGAERVELASNPYPGAVHP